MEAREQHVALLSSHIQLTNCICQCEQLTEEVLVEPVVVVPQVHLQVVEKHLLLLLLLDISHQADVHVHEEGVDLATLPVFPEPPRDIEQHGLTNRTRRVTTHEYTS